MNAIQWDLVLIGALACAAGPATIVLALNGYYSAAGAIIIACAIEVALMWLRRLETAADARSTRNRRPRFVPFHDDLTTVAR